MTEEDRQEVERSMCGQNTNAEWFRQRMGSITASQRNEISRLNRPKSRISKERLVKQVLGRNYNSSNFRSSLPSRDSLKWGITQEGTAQSQYKLLSSSMHGHMAIKESGFLVHEAIPFIRASPDGIVSCSCHPPRLLEIKCPYSTRDLTVEEAMAAGKIKYLSKGRATLSLLPSGADGYYTQVQCTMAVTGLKSCDFVVYTLKDLVVVDVPFDEGHWLADLASANGSSKRNLSLSSWRKLSHPIGPLPPPQNVTRASTHQLVTRACCLLPRVPVAQ